MGEDVPDQVTAFAHALAAHYPEPTVRVLTDTQRAIGDQSNAAVLLCVPLLDRIRDVEALLVCIQRELETSSLGILCARDAERGPRSSGPVELGQWTPDTLRAWLTREGIRVLFSGHTTAAEDDDARSIIVAILSGRSTPPLEPPPADFKVIALMNSFNEADIIGPSLDYFLEQGVQVHLLENWSTDGTDSIAAAREARGVRLERFPPGGRSDHYVITPILRRKEELAMELDADWFIHTDVDEIREGPFPGGGIREALYHAGCGGFNCVNSTLLEFPPIDDSFPSGGDYRSHFRFWRPATLSAHFLQFKIWRKTSATVNLTDRGGHDVSFEGRRIYPFQFLLRHYPFRSSQQASRKLFEERTMDPEELRLKRWGGHYKRQRQEFQGGQGSAVHPEGLRSFSSSFYDDYLIERLSAIGFRRP